MSFLIKYLTVFLLISIINSYNGLFNIKNKFLLRNFNKCIDFIFLDFFNEIKFKLKNKIVYDGFILNNLINLSNELKTNEFNYFPKLKLQKLNKYDKSRSEIQLYLKELFFNENPEYLDLYIMEEDIISIKNIKILVENFIKNVNGKIKNEENLLNLRWYLKENDINNLEDNTSDKYNNKSVLTKESLNSFGKENENYISDLYNNITNYFNFLIKIFEIDLVNNLNNPKDLLKNFNDIYLFYSKLIIVLDELLQPLNKIVNIKFKENFPNLPQYPQYNCLKFLIRIFYKYIYLNYKEYLENSFFELLKNKREIKINKLFKEININSNKVENKNIDQNEINNIWKYYIIFLEDISYNEVSINYNCYSKLNSDNEIEEFKNKFAQFSIISKKNKEIFIKYPNLILKYFKSELSFLSDLVLENFYLDYVIKMGIFFLKNIKDHLNKILIMNQNKYINDKMEEKIKRILLKNTKLDNFLTNNFNNLFNSPKNLNLLHLEKDFSVNEINNANYLFKNNINNFQKLISEFENLENFCENILFKFNENDNQIKEFNRKRGIPLDLGNKKEFYDLVSNIKKNHLIKNNIDNLFLDQDNSILTKTNCSLKLDEKFDSTISNNFKLPGYEEIINEFEDSFENLKL